MSSTSDFFGTGGSYEPRMKAVEQQVSQFIAGEVGKIVYFPTWYTPPHLLYIKPNGAMLSKTTYAALWGAISGSAITSTEYDATVASSPVGACSRYADVDEDTFRVPTNGTGGFIRGVGEQGEMPLGTEDGGFGSQIEDHKHIVPIITTASVQLNLATVRGKTPFGEITPSDINPDLPDMSYVHAISSAITTTSPNLPMPLTSHGTFEHIGETSPQGTYAQPYIFTGIVVSYLPEPTGEDLAQIQTNTDAIVEHEVRLDNLTPSYISAYRDSTTVQYTEIDTVGDGFYDVSFPTSGYVHFKTPRKCMVTVSARMTAHTDSRLLMYLNGVETTGGISEIYDVLDFVPNGSDRAFSYSFVCEASTHIRFGAYPASTYYTTFNDQVMIKIDFWL